MMKFFSSLAAFVLLVAVVRPAQVYAADVDVLVKAFETSFSGIDSKTFFDFRANAGKSDTVPADLGVRVVVDGRMNQGNMEFVEFIEMTAKNIDVAKYSYALRGLRKAAVSMTVSGQYFDADQSGFVTLDDVSFSSNQTALNDVVGMYVEMAKVFEGKGFAYTQKDFMDLIALMEEGSGGEVSPFQGMKAFSPKEATALYLKFFSALADAGIFDVQSQGDGKYEIRVKSNLSVDQEATFAAGFSELMGSIYGDAFVAQMMEGFDVSFVLPLLSMVPVSVSIKDGKVMGMYAQVVVPVPGSPITATAHLQRSYGTVAAVVRPATMANHMEFKAFVKGFGAFEELVPGINLFEGISGSPFSFGQMNGVGVRDLDEGALVNACLWADDELACVDYVLDLLSGGSMNGGNDALKGRVLAEIRRYWEEREQDDEVTQ